MDQVSKEIPIFIASKKELNKNEVTGDQSVTSRGTINYNADAVIVWDYDITEASTQDEVNLAQYNQAITLGHETWHAMAATVYQIVEEEHSVNINSWRKGLGSLHSQQTLPDEASIFDTCQSLEEGLAAYNEENVIKPLAAQLFTEGKRIRDENAPVVALRLGVSPDEVNITKVDNTTGNIVAQHLTYQNSRKLVEYLINVVPNFQSLAEKVRHGSPIDELAVAVDDKLGVGTYNDLTHVVEATASRYLSKLNPLS